MKSEGTYYAFFLSQCQLSENPNARRVSDLQLAKRSPLEPKLLHVLGQVDWAHVFHVFEAEDAVLPEDAVEDHFLQVSIQIGVLDLELVDAERDVGDFAADLLAGRRKRRGVVDAILVLLDWKWWNEKRVLSLGGEVVDDVSESAWKVEEAEDLVGVGGCSRWLAIGGRGFLGVVVVGARLDGGRVAAWGLNPDGSVLPIVSVLLMLSRAMLSVDDGAWIELSWPSQRSSLSSLEAMASWW